MSRCSFYADSLEYPTWTWEAIYDKLKIVVDDMNDAPGGHRDKTRVEAESI